MHLYLNNQSLFVKKVIKTLKENEIYQSFIKSLFTTLKLEFTSNINAYYEFNEVKQKEGKSEHYNQSQINILLKNVHDPNLNAFYQEWLKNELNHLLVSSNIISLCDMEDYYRFNQLKLKTYENMIDEVFVFQYKNKTYILDLIDDSLMRSLLQRFNQEENKYRDVVTMFLSWK